MFQITESLSVTRICLLLTPCLGHDDPVDRLGLAALLDRPDEAFAACRADLLLGADFTIDQESVARLPLYHTYARRERLTRRQGRAALGFTEAVDDLWCCELDELRMGHVLGFGPWWRFELLLTQDVSQVITCFGLSQPGQQWSGVAAILNP